MANLNDIYNAASAIDSNCYWMRFPDGKEPPGVVIREVSHSVDSYLDNSQSVNNWVFRVYVVDASYPNAKAKLAKIADVIAPLGAVQRDSNYTWYHDEKVYEAYREYSLWGEESGPPVLGASGTQYLGARRR